MRFRPLLAALALLCPVVADAAVDPALMQDLAWRHIGPFRGGRVLTVAGDPRDAMHFYFGAVNGGVWQTRDAGRTWQPIFDGQPVGTIGALALAPSNPDVIYVGTGEADMRSDIAQGEGMFRSDDAGRTWQRIGLEDTQQVAKVLVDPRDAKHVYVAALGHPYGQNEQRGVFESRDAGAHWRKVLGPDADTGAIDLVFEPGNPEVIYAALWQTRRTPWSVYPPSNGPGSGLYKSTDGGAHWSKLENGLPRRVGHIGLAIGATAPKRIYAVVDSEPPGGSDVRDQLGGGVYRSDDAGATWRLATGDTRTWQRGWYFGTLAVDPTNADRVWALNTIVLRSDDGGATFVAEKGDVTGDDFHDLWIDPKDPRRRIIGADQGAIVTLNAGATWSSWHNQPTAQMYHVNVDNRFPYFVYGAQQDSGAAGVPSRTTTYDGINLTQFREVTAGGESDNIAPDPKDPEVIYGGRVDRLDLRTHQTRHVPPTLRFPVHHRTTWTLPLVFSPRDPTLLYFAHQNLYRTNDGGSNWQQISPDLTREDPGTPPNLDATTAALNLQMGPRRGVIYAIAPSRTTDGDIWVGTDDGQVWRTRDGGTGWANITPKALTPWSKVGIIDASPHDSDTAYIAVDRHRLDDFRPYIYRTHDGGKRWDLVVNGIAATHAVNVVREDPSRRGLLYAGTERGAYVSFDDGDHWQPLQLNLPVTSVRDIVLKDNDIVIATHGRGFWILDDATPLRALAADGSRTTRLLAPAPAWRVRPEGFTGTPFPKEEPAAANPPPGAVIDYVLAQAPSAPVVLTIEDSAGRMVRRFSSADVPPARDEKSATAAPEWDAPRARLATTPGQHRFTWSLHYAPPDVLAEGNAWADGAWAPPGRYRVLIEVDGKRHEQALELRPDPRVQLDQGAYDAQFTLALGVETLRAEVATRTNSAKALQKALSARRLVAGGRERELLDAFQQRVIAVTGSVPASNPSNTWWLPPKRVESLRWLTTQLELLAQVVDGADAAPSDEARAGLQEVQARMPAAFAAWEELEREGLAELNTKLERGGFARVKPAL